MLGCIYLFELVFMVFFGITRREELLVHVATHSSTLAWKIPCMEERGRL